MDCSKFTCSSFIFYCILAAHSACNGVTISTSPWLLFSFFYFILNSNSIFKIMWKHIGITVWCAYMLQSCMQGDQHWLGRIDLGKSAWRIFHERTQNSFNRAVSCALYNSVMLWSKTNYSNVTSNLDNFWCIRRGPWRRCWYWWAGHSSSRLLQSLSGSMMLLHKTGESSINPIQFNQFIRCCTCACLCSIQLMELGLWLYWCNWLLHLLVPQIHL